MSKKMMDIAAQSLLESGSGFSKAFRHLLYVAAVKETEKTDTSGDKFCVSLALAMALFAEQAVGILVEQYSAEDVRDWVDEAAEQALDAEEEEHA